MEAATCEEVERHHLFFANDLVALLLGLPDEIVRIRKDNIALVSRRIEEALMLVELTHEQHQWVHERPNRLVATGTDWIISGPEHVLVDGSRIYLAPLGVRRLSGRARRRWVAANASALRVHRTSVAS